MSRKSGKPHFYELGTGMDSPGNFSRRHIIRCNRCDASVGFKALNDEQLRKRAIHLGWDVGKTQTQHLCPKHARKEQSRPLPIVEVRDVPPMSPRVMLKDAWEQASQNERLEFLILLRRDYPEITPKSELPPSSGGWQHGPHIDNMPTEPPLSAIKQPPAVVEPDPEELEVADIIFGKQKRA